MLWFLWLLELPVGTPLETLLDIGRPIAFWTFWKRVVRFWWRLARWRGTVRPLLASQAPMQHRRHCFSLRVLLGFSITAWELSLLCCWCRDAKARNIQMIRPWAISTEDAKVVPFTKVRYSDSILQ